MNNPTKGQEPQMSIVKLPIKSILTDTGTNLLVITDSEGTKYFWNYDGKYEGYILANNLK